jgi:hypothetical protein
MELTLQREPSNTKCTIGELDIDGQFEAYTCEDIVRPVKIKGETAIPAGRYQVVITMSARFKRELPLLLNVPNFEGVRIHTGNTASDTEGCILVGQELGDMSVLNSRAAFAHLFPKIQEALQDGGECWITIKDAN